VELLVLVDRRHHRDLPIEPDYCGIRVDSLDSERVMVRLKEGGTRDSVWIETRD
jgi:pyrimidine operon attenuation protein/uracil phosphoribosyltransferase